MTQILHQVLITALEFDLNIHNRLVRKSKCANSSYGTILRSILRVIFTLLLVIKKNIVINSSAIISIFRIYFWTCSANRMYGGYHDTYILRKRKIKGEYPDRDHFATTKRPKKKSNRLCDHEWRRLMFIVVSIQPEINIGISP